VILSMLLAGGCTLDKGPGFGGGGDGGAGDGGGDGGGGPDPVLPEDVNVHMPCDSVTRVAATHFDGADYYDPEAVEPYECMCEYTSTSTPEIEIEGIVVGGNDGAMHFPMKVAATMPWHTDTSGNPMVELDWYGGTGTMTHIEPTAYPWTGFVDGDDDVFGGSGGLVIAAVQGPWRFYIPNRGWVDNMSSHLVECDAITAGNLWIEVQTPASESTPTPPPTPVNPLSVEEDDMACGGTSPRTTGMRLIDLPGWTHPVAIGISGERQYAFAKMHSLFVTAWNGADHLTIVGESGASVTLTPSSSSATLSSGTYWLGTTRWLPSRQDSSGSWTNPALSVTHSCPSSVGTTTRPVDQGYALTLGMLAAAIDGATGGAGLGGIMTGAPETDWPVYVARVFPIVGSPLAGGEDFVLTLEPQGSDALIWLPVTRTSFNHWSLAASGDGWAVDGTIARVPNTLVVTLTSGNAGPIELNGTVLNLPEYPDDGQ